MGYHRAAKNFLPFSIVGYGLHFALVCLVGWPGSSSVFMEGLADDGILGPFAFAKSLSFCLAFFVWSACALRFDRSLSRLLACRLTWWLFSALLVISGMGLVAMAYAHVHNGMLETACGVLMGAAVSGNFTLWQRTLCSRPTPIDARGLIGGTVVGGCLYFLTLWMPSQAVRVLALAIMAPGAALLLMLCNDERFVGRAEDKGEAREGLSYGEAKAALRKGLLALIMPCVTIGAIGFAMQALRIALVQLDTQDAFLSNLYNAATVLGPSVLFLMFERNRYRVDMGVFYRVGAPVIGLAMLLLPVAGTGFQFATSVVLYAVFAMASIMGILACNQVSRTYGTSPIALYALCFGIIYLTRFAPVLVWGTGRGGISGVALVCLALLFACYVASDRFQGRQEAACVWSWESELPARTPEQAVRELGESRGLTARECEVLLLMCTGRGVPAIAEKIGVSQNTVRFHAKNLYAKLGVHSRQEVIDKIDALSTK